jgi:hypothetical protein
MAYKTTINKACANREIAIEEIHNQLLAMGWTYVDGMCDLYNIPYTDVNTTDNTFTMAGHTYSNSQPVHVRTTGTVPGGLAINTQYYVVTVVSGVSFKLSSTYNGSAIDITTQGSGTHTISESFRIYKSNSEASNQIYQYVKLSKIVGPTKINVYSPYHYNLTTRAIVAISYGTSFIETNQTGFYLWIHGDKDKVHITTKVASTYYRFWFGFMKPFIPLKTTVSGAITTGSNVVIPVENSTGFEAGYPYQIVGAYAEGRDTLTSTAVESGTITVSSLPRNYAAGAMIGHSPLIFGNADHSSFYSTCAYGVAGINDVSYGASVYGNVLIPVTSADPDMRSSKYILQPLSCSAETDNASTFNGVQGYINTNMLIAPNINMVIEDTFAVAKLSSGTSSGSNSTTVLNDTTKSWTINAYSGKVIIITFGSGSGMIKKIDSNTSTSISLSGSDWVFETTPDATSQYIICEEGYRYMAHGTGTGTANQVALREGY